jgi:hypothetical protein
MQLAHEERIHYPSYEGQARFAGTDRKERKEYTGDYITGIATMHKSNLVPVGRDDDPEIYAKMRR